MICFRPTKRFAFVALLLVGLFACPLSLVAGKGNGNGGGGNGGGGGEEPPPIAFSIDFLPVDHFPQGMNDLGQVCGYGPGSVAEFVWLADGTIVYEDEIATEPEGWEFIRFEDINNNGQIVGRAGAEDYIIFRITPGDGETPPVIEDLGMHGQTNYRPHRMNNHGEVAGEAIIDSDFVPVLYTDEFGVIELGSLTAGGGGVGIGVNDWGEVVGFSALDVGNVTMHAYRVLPGQTMQDLGDLDPRSTRTSKAYDINDSGAVVGHSLYRPNKQAHAFVYTDQTGMIDLGALPDDEGSDALGINNQGLIVGQSGDLSVYDGLLTAFLHVDGTMYRLSDLVLNLPAGCELIVDRGDLPIRINEYNEICGTALFADGTMAGYRLMPLP